MNRKVTIHTLQITARGNLGLAALILLGAVPWLVGVGTLLYALRLL